MSHQTARFINSKILTGIHTLYLAFATVRPEGLGGAMWWEASADKKEDQSWVLGNSGYLVSGRTLNLLDYPQSKYPNLQNMSFSFLNTVLVLD